MAADFALTLRTANRRGIQRSAVYEEIAPRTGITWILYIHGFNVSKREAALQWHTFRQMLPLEGHTDRLQAGLLYWPSDQFGWSLSAYPKMIDEAEGAGRALGEYLLERTATSTVLVGHSMGAIVAVEAANWARDGGLIEGLVLLGAAVKSRKMAPAKGRYAKIGRYGKVLARNEAVGYSDLDRTLRYWFPLGETAQAPYDPRDEAVGLTGQPSDRGWLTRKSERRSHSYWKFPMSAELTGWALGGQGLRRAAEHVVNQYDPQSSPIS